MEGITYFLAAEKELVSVEVDDRFRKDVDPVLSYYHILDNPSSSALLTLVLNAIDGIISSEKRHQCEDDGVIIISRSVKEQIESFIKEVEINILPSRKCHAALFYLVECIKKQLDEKHINNMKSWVEKKKKEIGDKKRDVRYSAARYLSYSATSVVDVERIVKNRFFKKNRYIAFIIRPRFRGRK